MVTDLLSPGESSWWTSMLKLHTFTLSSADAPWLKGVREGALAVARTASSDSSAPRASAKTSQKVCANLNPSDNSCTGWLSEACVYEYYPPVSAIKGYRFSMHAGLPRPRPWC